MTFTSFLPVIAGILFIALASFIAFTGERRSGKIWPLPAALSVLFFLFSLYAVLTAGPIGFWPEHTRNLWGNQIWLDLLLAASVGWFLIVPPAKALGMRVYPWLVFVICTGSIGLLAMIARLLYLQEREP